MPELLFRHFQSTLYQCVIQRWSFFTFPAHKTSIFCVFG
nr:MAG TPA: hypothetical protein [Caudoviricetes sp.]DAQ42130.1 MAG TPA: hypothetical protein [Caudoviricetes sp.]